MKVYDWSLQQEREYDASAPSSSLSSHDLVLFPGFVDVI